MREDSIYAQFKSLELGVVRLTYTKTRLVFPIGLAQTIGWWDVTDPAAPFSVHWQAFDVPRGTILDRFMESYL